MSWTPANSFGTRAAHPSRIRVLSEHRESTYPSQVVTCRPHFSPALRPHKSFNCNTYKKPGEGAVGNRSEEHTSELQSRLHLVCRLLLEKKKKDIHSLQ